MLNPFPGMNPYLESRLLWPGVHLSLITYMQEALQPQLNPRYVATIGERIQLFHRAGSVVPDVTIYRDDRADKRLKEGTATYVVKTGQAPIDDEPMYFQLFDEPISEPYIEIKHTETDKVVTLVELLSPANKEGIGHEQYLTKQNNLLASDVNLVEIDLIAHGKPTVLARLLSQTQSEARWRYIINVSRAQRRSMLEVYGLTLLDRLPQCRIPLLSPDEDVPLDLGALLNRCYRAGSFQLRIDYTKPPATPISTEEAKLIETLLSKQPES